MSCTCNEQTRGYYRYYDTPDGCDVLKKTIVTTRYGAITGLIFSTYDVLFFSHAVGVIPVLKRYAYHIVPLGLMGATFAVVANGALQYRKKDDPINYFFGGMACAPLVGAYLRSGHAYLLGGLALGIIGMLKKDAVDHNYTILPIVPSHMGSITQWRHDYTLRADPLDAQTTASNMLNNTIKHFSSPRWTSVHLANIVYLCIVGNYAFYFFGLFISALLGQGINGNELRHTCGRED